MKKSCIYVLSAFLVLGIFTGCQNFLNGSVLKKELDEKIAYANATKVTFEMRVDNASYGTIYPASATVIKGESFEVTFTQMNPDDYCKWVIYDSDSRAIPGDCITTKDISSEVDENGYKITKIRISVNTDSYSKIILKPAFNLVPPELNEVKVYRDSVGHEISYDAPETWNENVRTVEYYNDPEITENTFKYTKYFKYKDTPYYQNVVSEIYLDLTAKKSDIDIAFAKVELKRIKDSSNNKIENSKSEIVKIPAESFCTTDYKNYTLCKIPVQSNSIYDGLFNVTVSIVDYAGLESNKKEFWVIKHTPNQGSFNIKCNSPDYYNDAKKIFDYCVNKKNGETYEYLEGSAEGVKNNYFTDILCCDNFYSVGGETLSIPLKIDIYYYDEGDSEKQTFLKVDSLGTNSYIDITSATELITNVQKPVFENLDANPLKYNVIKRNPQKNTYLEVKATSDFGFELNKKLTIPKASPAYDYFTISENSLNFKYYVQNSKINSQKTEDNYLFLYEDITDSSKKSYLYKKGAQPALTGGKTYKVYIFNKNSDFYMTEGSDVFYIPIMSTTSFEFKYNGSNSWSSVNSKTPQFPSAASLTFNIDSNPPKNSTYVNVHTNTPGDGLVYEYTFTYSYRHPQSLPSYNDYANMTIVTQGPDLKLPSEFKHKLTTITAKDKNGGFISSNDYSANNIYVDLTSVDVTPPVIDYYQLYYYIAGPNMLYIQEDGQLLADNGSESGFKNGLLTNSKGEVEVHYWIKENSLTITEEDLKDLTEYVAYYDYPTTCYTTYHCIPLDGANSGTNTVLLRFYDNHGNYADKVLVNDASKISRSPTLYYNGNGKWTKSGTKPYFYLDFDSYKNELNYRYYSGVNNEVFNSNNRNILEGINGYEVRSSGPALIQVFCSKTNMKKDVDLWSLRGMEIFVKQITADFTVVTDELRIPDNHYWCIVVHYADGSKIMTPVEYKAK